MFELKIFVVFCFCATSFGQVDDDPLVVDAGPLGRIRGQATTTMEDNGVRRPYLQFKGIRYATIPQRFLPSNLLEVDHGNGDVYNATLTPNSCYQPLLPEVMLQEDCLYLTVYTRQKDTGNATDRRPVLFFIHGGEFTVGQGSSFSGIRLMNRDVVLVSISYRLGLFGFFSLQNEAIPGNAAMYDVVNALQWVNNYIKYFGGDPNSITIAGQNAGAVTVTDLMASPMARGLFHRAIAASGSALNVWKTRINSADVIKGALDVSQRAGCYDGVSVPDDAIGRCMQSVPGRNLVHALDGYQLAERREGRLGFSIVSPVVQSFELLNHPKFLPEDPAVVFAEGREAPVPLMMSTTKHDGSNIMGIFYNMFLRDNGLDMNATFLRYDLVPAVLNALGVPDSPSGIYETISRTYLGNAPNSGDFNLMYPGLMDIFSVFSYKGDCYKTALLHSRKTGSPTFWGSFDFKGNVSFWGQLYPGDRPPPFPGGVSNTDDLIYLFALTFLPFSDLEAAVSSQMLSYWADFAKAGQPHPDWPELRSDTQAYRSMNHVPLCATDFPSKWAGLGYEAGRR